MEGDPTGVGRRKEEQRVSESTSTHCAADCTLMFETQERRTALKSADDFLERSAASTQLLHVNPSSSCGGRRAAIHSDVRPSSLQSISQTCALLSDTRVLHYAAQRSTRLPWDASSPELRLLNCRVPSLTFSKNSTKTAC